MPKKIKVQRRKYTGDNVEINITEKWAEKNKGPVSNRNIELTPFEAHDLLQQLATELGMQTFRAVRYS